MITRDPGWDRVDQQTLLCQSAHAIGFDGEQIELVFVERLRCVLRHQNRRPLELSKQAISDGRKERPQLFVHSVPGLDLEHDQRRMGGEKSTSPRDNSLLFALGVDLDEVDGGPPTHRAFHIKAGDADRLARPGCSERAQLARRGEGEIAFSGAVRKGGADNFEIAEIVQGAALFQERAGFRPRLVREDAPAGSNEAGHR